MNLDSLRALVTLADTGSLLGAARALRTSRAAVRRRLDALEAQVGVPLYARARDGATLTAAGEALVHGGRPLLQQASAILTAARELGADAQGVLRVLAPVGLPPQLIVMMAAHMREAFPKLQLRVRFCGDPVGEALDDVDLVFHLGARTPQGQWITSVVFRLHERLIATRAYLARAGAPARPEELHQHPLFTWEPPGEDPALWTTRDGQTLPVALALCSSDVHMVRQCVLAGMGIGRVPDGDFPDPGVEPGEVVTLLPAFFGRDCSLRALVPEALAEVPKVRLALQFLRGVLQTL